MEYKLEYVIIKAIIKSSQFRLHPAVGSGQGRRGGHSPSSLCGVHFGNEYLPRISLILQYPQAVIRTLADFQSILC